MGVFLGDICCYPDDNFGDCAWFWVTFRSQMDKCMNVHFLGQFCLFLELILVTQMTFFFFFNVSTVL